MAEALAGGVTVAGLMVQTGGSIVACDEAVTWQVRSTVPLKPGSVVTEMFEEDVPPGATALGESGDASILKFCATAEDDKVRKAATRQNAVVAASRVRKINLDFEESDFNMSGFK